MEWLHRNKPLYPIYYTNPLRFFSVIILVFFSWICIEPWNYALAAEARKHSAKSASNSSKNSPAKSFEDTLKAVQKLIDEMDEAVGSGKDISLDLETLIGHEGNLGQLNKAILAEFAETKAFITEKNLAPVIHDRHSTAVADYKKNFKELNLHLQAIKKLGKAKDRDLPKAVKKAKGFLDKNVKKPRHQPLDPNNLPHRTAKPTKKKPRMTREAFLRDFGMEEEAGKVVPVSYDGKGIPGATFASHPPNDDLPTAADLAETIEVQFTDEINALAEELENNPVKIYNWVRNNIDFVPTYGSIQGANHCLLTKQCNDMDTASLLIALLRTSGIPARYVMGTIELPIDQVMNWVGGFTDEQAAINFIASSGTPVVGVGSGGKIVAVRMEHTWVGAYADYAPSRGSVNEVGEDWIPIDASFKSHISVLNVTIRNSIPFDFPGFLDQIIDTGTIDITQPSITSIEEILMQDTINAYKDQVQAYIDQNYTDPRINDVFGYISIKEQSLGVLPFSLPYKVNVGGEPFTEIPMALRHKINIRASSGPLGLTDIDYFSFLSDISGKRISFSFEPATSNDDDLIFNYLNESSTEIPAYLVNFKPKVKINGVEVASGQATGMGALHKLDLIFEDPSFGNDISSHLITAGDFVVIGLNVAGVTGEMIQERIDLQLFTTSGTQVNEIVGEMLHQVILSYWGELKAFSRLIALQSEVIVSRLPSAGFASSNVTVSTLYGLPYMASYRSRSLDIQRDIQALASKVGNEVHASSYFLQTGVIGSALEGLIFDQLFTENYGEGVSTILLLSIANEQGVPIHAISPSNMDSILPNLDISQEVKTDIRNAVNRGRVAFVPYTEITHGNWTGVGYALLNPVTGEGAYLISGGLAGGESETEGETVAPLPEVPLPGAAGLVIGALSGGSEHLGVETKEVNGVIFVVGIVLLAVSPPIVKLAAGAAAPPVVLGGLAGIIITAGYIFSLLANQLRFYKVPPNWWWFRHYTFHSKVAAILSPPRCINMRFWGDFFVPGTYLTDLELPVTNEASRKEIFETLRLDDYGKTESYVTARVDRNREYIFDGSLLFPHQYIYPFKPLCANGVTIAIF